MLLKIPEKATVLAFKSTFITNLNAREDEDEFYYHVLINIAKHDGEFDEIIEEVSTELELMALFLQAIEFMHPDAYSMTVGAESDND